MEKKEKQLLIKLAEFTADYNPVQYGHRTRWEHNDETKDISTNRLVNRFLKAQSKKIKK